jgi:hypothetical protein
MHAGMTMQHACTLLAFTKYLNLLQVAFGSCSTRLWEFDPEGMMMKQEWVSETVLLN